jgi:hypothetical protein
MTAASRSQESMSEEFPSTEHEAFVATGHAFFNMKRVNQDIRFIAENKVGFRGYKYVLGENFLNMRMEEATHVDNADLRVWEPPKRNGVYVFGIDPAFGRSEEADRSVVSVWRCFADKMVQVAEYATPIPDTRQVAWVMAHLAGLYRDCMVNLEINGAGPVIMQELDHLRQMMNLGLFKDVKEESGLKSLFSNVRWYIYHRLDTTAGSYNLLNFKTTMETKLPLMNQMRDAYILDALVVNSIPLLKEMQTVVQDGGEIAASGANKDDRVFAAALAIKAWIDWVRPDMMARRASFEEISKIESEPTQIATMGRHIVADFFVGLKRQSQQKRLEAAWGDDMEVDIGYDDLDLGDDDYDN